VIEQRLPVTLRTAQRLLAGAGAEIGGRAWLPNGNELDGIDASGSVEKVTLGSSIQSTIGDVAIGEGSVWATDNGTNQVWQVDPIHASVVRGITVGHVPLGVTVGAGSVWVTSGADGTITRIDPIEGTTTATITTCQTPARLTLADGLLWATID
jgi:streptogramin lyase